MADRPTQEWLKKERNAGTARKTGYTSLPLPNDDTLTLEQSRADDRGGITPGYFLGDDFYKVGPLTAKNTAPHSTDLIGGRHPQQGPNKLDTEDEGGVFVVKPLPGARRQLVQSDADVKPSYGAGKIDMNDGIRRPADVSSSDGDGGKDVQYPSGF